MATVSTGTESEMMAELERAKQASRAACLDEIRLHLDGFAMRQPAASYEDWIAELHPESLRSGDGFSPSIDYRYYLEDSDHRVIWNSKVGAWASVPARDPSLEAAMASAFPPGVDVSVPPLPLFPMSSNSTAAYVPPLSALDGFRTMGGMPMGYRPSLNRSYVPPPEHLVPRPVSWLPPPPPERRDVVLPAWASAMSPPANSRSYVTPLDVAQQQRARSYIADPLFSGAPPVTPSSWLPPRGVASPVMPRVDSRMGAPAELFMSPTDAYPPLSGTYRPPLQASPLQHGVQQLVPQATPVAPARGSFAPAQSTPVAPARGSFAPQAGSFARHEPQGPAQLSRSTGTQDPLSLTTNFGMQAGQIPLAASAQASRASCQPMFTVAAPAAVPSSYASSSSYVAAPAYSASVAAPNWTG